MNNEIIIRNLDPQEITINEGGTVTGITNVYVNGTDVTIGTKAYVIVPTKLSELTNDEGFITNAEETDPTVPSYVKEITMADINSWNDKQDELVSGSNIKTINNNSLLGSGDIEITATEYVAGTGIDITGDTISNTITSYNDLTDLPTPITNTSQLVNDSGFITNRVDDLQNYLTTSVLESILPHSSDSGTEPLYLENSANYKLDITLNPSEIQQKTLTGKNLCPNEMINGDSSGVVYTRNEDGTITINGTATARVEPDLYNDGSRPILFKAGTYRNTSSRLIIMYAGGYYSISANNTIIIGSDINVTRIYFRIENGESDLDEIYYPQIIDNSILDTSYEPYTGGMPSPNPLYPQDIHVTTGENSITVCNKNLFSEWISGTVNTTTGEITSVPRNMTDYIPVNPSTSYALWREDTGFATYFMEYDANKGFVREQHISSANTSGIFTTSATTKFVILFQYTTYSPTNKAQLEVGSSNTSYVPHQETVYPIDLGTTEYLKIGDTADRIFKNVLSDPDYMSNVEIGKWCIRDNIYTVYVADTGEFTDVVEYPNKYVFYNYSPIDVPRQDVLVTPYGKSIYFNNDPDNNNNLIRVFTNYLIIELDKKIGISTLEDLNQWISDNNVIVYFELKPDYFYGKGAVNDTLNEQLTNLSQAMAYEGGTNITQENDDLPFDIVADTLEKISN